MLRLPPFFLSLPVSQYANIEDCSPGSIFEDSFLGNLIILRERAKNTAIQEVKWPSQISLLRSFWLTDPTYRPKAFHFQLYTSKKAEITKNHLTSEENTNQKDRLTKGRMETDSAERQKLIKKKKNKIKSLER